MDYLADSVYEFYLPPPLTTVFQLGVGDLADTCHICWLKGLPSLQILNMCKIKALKSVLEISPNSSSFKQDETGSQQEFFIHQSTAVRLDLE